MKHPSIQMAQQNLWEAQRKLDRAIAEVRATCQHQNTEPSEHFPEHEFTIFKKVCVECGATVSAIQFNEKTQAFESV